MNVRADELGALRVGEVEHADVVLPGPVEAIGDGVIVDAPVGERGKDGAEAAVGEGPVLLALGGPEGKDLGDATTSILWEGINSESGQDDDSGKE